MRSRGQLQDSEAPCARVSFKVSFRAAARTPTGHIASPPQRRRAHHGAGACHTPRAQRASDVAARVALALVYLVCRGVARPLDGTGRHVIGVIARRACVAPPPTLGGRRWLHIMHILLAVCSQRLRAQRLDDDDLGVVGAHRIRLSATAGKPPRGHHRLDARAQSLPRVLASVASLDRSIGQLEAEHVPRVLIRHWLQPRMVQRLPIARDASSLA